MEIVASLLHRCVTKALLTCGRRTLSKVLGLEDTGLRKDATLVGSKVLVCLEITSGWTVSEDILHHLLFCHLSITSTNDVGALDLGDWLTFFELRA